MVLNWNREKGTQGQILFFLVLKLTWVTLKPITGSQD